MQSVGFPSACADEAQPLPQGEMRLGKKGVNPMTGEPFSKTGTQANFESRESPEGAFTSNVHLDILD